MMGSKCVGLEARVKKRDRDGEIDYLRCWWDWT